MNFPEETKILRQIYDALQDDESRMIYSQRLLYSLTGDEKHIVKMLSELCEMKHIDPRPLAPQGKYCVYGAGDTARMAAFGTLAELCDCKPEYYIDKYKTGMIDGIPIISLDEFCTLPDYKNYRLFIAVGARYMPEVVADLVDRDIAISGDYIEYAKKDLGTEQYFDLPALALTDNEVFVDVGCCNGDDTQIFLHHCSNGIVYAFEPHPLQYALCQQNIGSLANVSLYPYGAYDKKAQVLFSTPPQPSSGICGDGAIDAKGNIEIETIRLDDLLADKRITFIKMDIEGAELAALRGCEQIIKEQKPKLAISIYHKAEDIWELPALIASFNANYRFYLRHYRVFSAYETVLYAV